MQDKVMNWIQQAFIVTYEKVKVWSMTLNFELAARFLFATHPLVMIIICATLFTNPNTDDQVMGRHEQVSLKSMDKV